MLTLRSSLALPVLAALYWSVAVPHNPELPTVQDPVRVKQMGFVLEEGDIAVEDLVAKAQRFLGVNILLEPAALTHNNNAPITLSKVIAVDVNGCWDVLSQLLWTRGLVLTPINEDVGLWEVVVATGQRRAEIPQRALFVEAERLPRYSNRMVWIQTPISLKYVHAQVANNALRPFFAQMGGGANQGIQIGNIGDQTSLIVAGFGPQVQAVSRLISQIDQPPADPRRLEERLKAIEVRLAALEGVSKGGK